MTLRYLYLPGDSYPQDDPIREAFERRLGQPLPAFDRKLRIEARVEKLRAAIEAEPDAQFVLIGRSSGGRVVTMVAADPELAPRILAVIVLGYPFKHPAHDLEPERFVHLPFLRVPCLIVQGDRDEYSRNGLMNRVPMSASTQVLEVDAAHNFQITPATWDLIMRRMALLLSSAIDLAA